ncbi:hypothetical protein TNCV_257231 [Trichonephila clavipes]|nr:hypothetical protein TNCV_257231 [Trichonephila clavipes]
MLKPYNQREENINLLCINPLKHDEEEDIPRLELENERSGWSKIISDVQLNSKLSQIQRGQLKELLYEYSNLFSNIPGCTDLAEHNIELESERAILAKPYRMSPRQIEILKSEVNKMLELKIIEPGESNFTSPLILVEAQGKEARPCIDYRRLNKVTRTQFFPLPNIEELLEKVSAAKYISILDLTRGYWQIPLSPRAQSRLMANLLRNCEDFAVPYLDDIAIFSLAWDDHLKHLKDVFDSLRSAKLHIKPSKCQFAQAYVKYLGHLVVQGLRTPGELKVQVIKDFPIPTNKTQCDASNLGIGVVLSQVCENEEHPIMFLSKKLSLAEQKYSTTEKECAAIIFAVQKLKCYLMDTKNLSYKLTIIPWSEVDFERLLYYVQHPKTLCYTALSLGGSKDAKNRTDGDKIICQDQAAPLRPPCLVYSFGVYGHTVSEGIAIFGSRAAIEFSFGEKERPAQRRSN